MCCKIKNLICLIILSALIIVSCKTSEPVQAGAEEELIPDLSSFNVQSPWTTYRASARRDFDIRHVSLDLTVDLQAPGVRGTAELILSPHFYQQELLTLDAHGMEIEKVSIDGQDWQQYDYDSLRLTIRLPRSYSAGEQLLCKVDYRIVRFGVPAQAGATGEGGIFVIDYWPGRQAQLWTQGETRFTADWYPTIDHPNQRYTQQVSLTVADSLTTLSNGYLQSQQYLDSGWRTDTWKLDVPHAPYLSMIAVGPFDQVRLPGAPVEAQVLGVGIKETGAVEAFGRTPEMIRFFETTFGVKFPWPVYNQVIIKDYISGAMENTGAVTFLEDINVTRQERMVMHFDDYIAHELAHHWFGNLVTCESWANLALNESFATYAEQLWNEYYYGEDSASMLAFRELNQYLDESFTKKEDLIRYYYQDADNDLFDSHSYAKGSRILHMLRLYVGDDAFFASLQKYLRDNRLQSVEVHDLRLAFEEVTGLDLQWFFVQWMLNSGHPVLEVSHYLRSDTLYLEVSQEQDLIEYPLFYLPLYLDVYWDTGVLTYPITIENQRHVFRIPAMGRQVRALVLDPDYQLVGTIDHHKSVKELTQQALLSGDIMVRYEAYIKLLSEENNTAPSAEVLARMLDEQNELLLVELLDRLDVHTSIDLKPGLERIRQLAVHTNPHVRASALTLLAELDKNIDWKNIYTSDTVSLVQGLALEYMIDNLSVAEKLDLFEELKHTQDLNFLLPLTFIANDEIRKGVNDWYQDKIWAARSSDQYYLLSAYNDYLLSAPSAERYEAIALLGRMARYHIDSETRLTAFEGLILLSETINVSGELEAVMAFERDKQLLALYRRFGPK